MEFEDLKGFVWGMTDYYINIINNPDPALEDHIQRRVAIDRAIGEYHGFYKVIMKHIERAHPARVIEFSEWLLNACIKASPREDWSDALLYFIADPLKLSIDELKIRRLQIRGGGKFD